MMECEKASYLASYDAWRAPPPEGWHSMADMPLRVVAADFLFVDGTDEEWPISNAQFLIDPRKPIAWRNPRKQGDILRRRIVEWATKTDDFGALWAAWRAVNKHEHSQKP